MWSNIGKTTKKGGNMPTDFKKKMLNLKKDLHEKLEHESRVTGINMNTVIVLALTEYLERKENKRNKK